MTMCKSPTTTASNNNKHSSGGSSSMDGQSRSSLNAATRAIFDTNNSSSVLSSGSTSRSKPTTLKPYVGEDESLSLTEAETDPADSSARLVVTVHHESAAEEAQSEESSGERTPLQANPQEEEHHDAAARKIQRISRQWSNQNKVRRQSQLDEFQQLQKKREDEVHRLEKIKQGRKVQNIRCSLNKFEETLEKNKQFGFDSAHESATNNKGLATQQQQQQRRHTDIAEVSLEDEDSSSASEYEEEMFLDEEEVSLTMEQLQQQHDSSKKKKKQRSTTHKAPPSRQMSTESTLLTPIKVRAGNDEDDSTIVSVDPPIPKIIAFGEDDDEMGMNDSQITLQSRWAAARPSLKEKAQSSRWEASGNSNKKSWKAPSADPVVYNRPRPTSLKQPEAGSRWAVHPRVVYGPPKTKKAVQMPEGERRWAASTPGKKKKTSQPKFPQNSSRWAAQTKQTSTRNLKPKRQITKDSSTTKIVRPTIRKPRRQKTKEGDEPIIPRHLRRRSICSGDCGGSISKPEACESEPETAPQATTTEAITAAAARETVLPQSNSMPMVDRSNSSLVNEENDPLSTSAAPKKIDNKYKLLNRSLSLGEVKQIVSVIRIQSIFRMYQQRYQYKLALQEQRKEEIAKETERELQHIRDCLLLRQQSILARMEREHAMGLSSSESSSSVTSNTSSKDDIDLLAGSLRKEIATLEASNQKLQSQMDRLKASNERMQGGNKTRQKAVKDVQGRLTKLQHIQTKLNKVYHDFQAEHAAISGELGETASHLNRERDLQEATKTCMRKILTLVRPKLSVENAELMEELEDTVPIDCVM